MNQVNLIGRITKDIELRYTSNQKAVCEFSLAVNRIGVEGTDFITVVSWEKQAENLQKYQGRGSLVAVSGELRVDVYKDNEEKNRYKTYVLAKNIEYLASKKNETNNQPIENVNENPFARFGEEKGTGASSDYFESQLPF